MGNLNVNKVLTFKEIQKFFSGNEEFEVREIQKNVTFQIKLKILWRKNNEGTCAFVDTLVYNPTTKILIKAIKDLGILQRVNFP